MKNNLFETANAEFAFPLKATIYTNMEVAIKAYQQLLNEYHTLFSFEKSTTTRGHLLTLFIEKQFSESSFNPKTSFFVRLQEVNKYKHKALFIETPNFIMNIARTQKSYSLPSKSNYKTEYAKNNSNLDLQYTLDFQNNCINTVLPKNYAFLTYGFQHDELGHLDIILPNHDYKSILYRIDLQDEKILFKNYIPEDIKEESIVSLKQEIQKII